MLLVTGITGHSGRWFLKRLVDENYPGRIRCVMQANRESSPDKYSIFKDCNLDIEFAVGDLNDKSFLLESLKGIDTLLHIAGIKLSPDLVATAAESGVNWMILVHTTGRYSKYKSASEEYIRIDDDILERCSAMPNGRQTINCTVLRPTMIYGSSLDRNMYRLIEYLDKHRFFPLFGAGSNLMQPVHARDLGNAYYDVLMHPDQTMNKEYNLSGKEPITYLNLIRIIQSQLKNRAWIIKLPISLSILAAKIYNALFKNAVITVEQVLRLQEDKAFSHEDAQKDFGYDPISFEYGIKEEIQEYLNGVRIDYTGVRY